MLVAGSLRKVFISFASFAVRVPVEDLDGPKFSKLCRDAKLLGKRFGSIDVDIVFAKVKVRSCSPQLGIIQSQQAASACAWPAT